MSSADARAGGGRLGRMVVVVAVVVRTWPRWWLGSDARRHDRHGRARRPAPAAAGESGTRAGERDQAGNDAAEQRQEDDGLSTCRAIDHQPFIRLMSSTAIEPRLRK